MSEINEVVKKKDEEIKRLASELFLAREEADGVKADYEQLKITIFRFAEKADDSLRYKSLLDRSEFSLFTGKWMALGDLLEASGLMDEFNRKEWK